MKHILLIAASTVALGACAQTKASPNWARIDGKSGTSLELEQARLICEPRANATAQASASAVAGNADTAIIGMVFGVGPEANVRAVKYNTLTSCMAERGYRLEQQ